MDYGQEWMNGERRMKVILQITISTLFLLDCPECITAAAAQTFHLCRLSICQSLLLMHCFFLNHISLFICFHAKWSGQTGKSSDLGVPLNYASELLLIENKVEGVFPCALMCL